MFTKFPTSKLITSSGLAVLPLVFRCEKEEGPPQRGPHVFDIMFGHRMKHGQADQPFIGVFGYRIAFTVVAETIAVVGMLVYRDVVNIHANIFGAKRAKNLSSACGEIFELQLDGVKVPRWVDSLAHYRASDAGK